MMMSRMVWAALVMLVVAGCGPIYETVYSYQPPRSPQGQMCAGQCQQISQYCKQNCRLQEDSCKSNSHREASHEFDRYVRERQRNHQEIKKQVSDFDHSYSCSSSSNCEASCGSDFRMCFTNCGGVVTSRQECTMFCDQKKM
ncbi:MAG: hypothetical protein WCO00_06275 [Rhodospirillaceae bacterium]